MSQTSRPQEVAALLLTQPSQTAELVEASNAIRNQLNPGSEVIIERLAEPIVRQADNGGGHYTLQFGISVPLVEGQVVLPRVEEAEDESEEVAEPMETGPKSLQLLTEAVLEILQHHFPEKFQATPMSRATFDDGKFLYTVVI